MNLETDDDRPALIKPVGGRELDTEATAETVWRPTFRDRVP